MSHRSISTDPHQEDDTFSVPSPTVSLSSSRSSSPSRPAAPQPQMPQMPQGPQPPRDHEFAGGLQEVRDFEGPFPAMALRVVMDNVLQTLSADEQRVPLRDPIRTVFFIADPFNGPNRYTK